MQNKVRSRLDSHDMAIVIPTPLAERRAHDLLPRWLPVLAVVVGCATPNARTSDPDTRPASSAAARVQEPVDASPAPSTSAAAIASALPPRAWPKSGERLPLEVPKGKAEAWAPVHPLAEEGAPVSVYFHGITASAQLECPVAWGAMQNGWVVCADGNVPYGGGFTWQNPGSKARVEAAIAALEAEHGDRVSRQRGLLIGYSMGAMPAYYLLQHSSESWTGLVFINAEFGVDPKVAKAKGLKRVAMIAAKGDRSSAKMKTTARNLARQGIDARFFTFVSKNGHFFDEETWKQLMPPLEWALTGTEASGSVPSPAQ